MYKISQEALNAAINTIATASHPAASFNQVNALIVELQKCEEIVEKPKKSKP